MKNQQETSSSATIHDVYPRKHVGNFLWILFVTHMAAAVVPSCIADQWLERRFTEDEMVQAIYAFDRVGWRAEDLDRRMRDAFRNANQVSCPVVQIPAIQHSVAPIRFIGAHDSVAVGTTPFVYGNEK